jgi:putative spermidine/putrescine transport system permease protein
MEAADALAPVPKRSVGRRLAGLFHGRPRIQAGLLLTPPLGWMVIVYLGSLAILFVAAFWTTNSITGLPVQSFSLDSFRTIVQEPVFRTVAFRTVAVAAAVTLTDALLAFPIAFYMAKIAGRKTRAALVVAVLMPLWSSYLVKVYAWFTILSADGVLNWALNPVGASGPGHGIIAIWLVFSYLWLPYMIIPIFAGLERIPNSLISASEDLGAGPFTTFRRVILPLALPAVVAGSIFTFALTLGDYVTPQIVSNTQLMGNLIFINFTQNLPLASAYATVPLLVMVIYLLIARRLGAFEQL